MTALKTDMTTQALAAEERHWQDGMQKVQENLKQAGNSATLLQQINAMNDALAEAYARHEAEEKLRRRLGVEKLYSAEGLEAAVTAAEKHASSDEDDYWMWHIPAAEEMLGTVLDIAENLPPENPLLPDMASRPLARAYAAAVSVIEQDLAFDVTPQMWELAKGMLTLHTRLAEKLGPSQKHTIEDGLTRIHKATIAAAERKARRAPTANALLEVITEQTLDSRLSFASRVASQLPARQGRRLMQEGLTRVFNAVSSLAASAELDGNPALAARRRDFATGLQEKFSGGQPSAAQQRFVNAPTPR